MIFFRSIAVALFLSLAFSSNIDREYSDSVRIKNPAIAWKLSLFPGVGQIYNESYGKSVFFIFSETYLLFQIQKHSHLIKTRNKFTWWFLAIYFINIIDAYVEAELTTFPEDNKKENN